MNPLNAPNWNYRWTALVVEELLRQGVQNFFISPGSRSTPLAWAVASHPEAYRRMHFDERGAAFAALGYARATNKPVALICTSGSAVANYFPAVIEADASRVPLLLLTADRPPELIDCGANQAIDQYKIFGDYLRWFQQLPCPGPELPVTMLLTTIAQALRRATGAYAGPVQLNFAFREPLAPTEMPMPAPEPALATWFASGQPYTRWEVAPTTLSASVCTELAGALTGAERGLLVVGQLRNPRERQAVRDLAVALGWPVFADITANLRLNREVPGVVRYYDALLRASKFAADCMPDCILHLGGPLVSKRLAQHLAATSAPYLHLDAYPERQDPDHRVTLRYEADLEVACGQIGQALSKEVDPAQARAWAQGWSEADDALDAYLSEALGHGEALTEPGVLRMVSRQCPEGGILFVGNSMPIRDLDMFAAAREKGTGPCITANRGASGIDGNIATAWGWACATGAPVTAVLGDLATLHDLNSLALLRDMKTPFTLVVLNNDGGGIFSFLPIATHETHFEQLFGTPHGMGFADAAWMFALNYHAPTTCRDFLATYDATQQKPGAHLIEVCTYRQENVVLHRSLQAGMLQRMADVGY